MIVEYMKYKKMSTSLQVTIFFFFQVAPTLSDQTFIKPVVFSKDYMIPSRFHDSEVLGGQVKVLSSSKLQQCCNTCSTAQSPVAKEYSGDSRSLKRLCMCLFRPALSVRKRKMITVNPLLAAKIGKTVKLVTQRSWRLKQDCSDMETIQ